MKNKVIIKCLLVGWACLLPALLLASQPPEEPARYWVSFSDKSGSPYSLSDPGAFLSERALLRRIRQGIPLEEADLPVNPQYVGALLSHPTVEVLYTSRWLNGALVSTSHEQVMEAIGRQAFVREVVLVKPAGVKKSGTAIPEHSKWQGVESEGVPDYGDSRTQVLQLNGQALHQEGFWGRDIHMAVLDAGFLDVDVLPYFERLRGEGRILGVRDFVDPAGDPYRSHFHGMTVLSVMAAESPGILLGTAPAASYWLLRTEDVSSEFLIEEYNWLAAAEMADSAGVDIINSSLGYTLFDDPSQNHRPVDLDGQTTVVARAASMAGRRGILVVNSAGNYGAGEWGVVGSPADSREVLAVGGVDARGMRVPFSSSGPTADGRIKPDVVAMGAGVAAVTPVGAIGGVNGTSYASPLVAGMAACLWERFQFLSARDLRELIRATASQAHNPDMLSGYGIPDFGKAVLSLAMGLASADVALIPNPVSWQSRLVFFSDWEGPVTVEIFGTKGDLVYRDHRFYVRQGHNQLSVFSRLPSIPRGMLLVRILGPNQSISIKAVNIN